jgi:hypothetical protein
MTKKCIAARKRYRAKKAGVPARRKKGKGFITDAFGARKKKRRGAGTLGEWSARGNISKGRPKRKYVIQGKKWYPLKRMVDPGKYNLMTGKMGSGLRRRRRGRGRGRRRRGPQGAGFFEDLGKSFEWVGNAALTALPFIAAVL